MAIQPETIRVHLAERGYDIAIGEGNLATAGRFLADRAKTTHIALITDEHVHRPHATQVAESLGEQEIEVDVIVIPPGEESKSIDVALSLWQGFLELGANRHTVVVAVGGGVVGDLAGFIAATYARGLRLLQVPTSLLAQVDSSIGGKVGINLPEAKNMVGAFHQPVGVLIDPAALSTLPEAEFRAGMAEVVKYGAAMDAGLFDYLETNAAAILEHRPEALRHMIANCCRLKADVVERDEHEETGLRAVLNFGHTFGHAFEAILGYGTLLHGEAVSIGMVLAMRLAERLGRIDAKLVARVRDLLRTFGLPTDVPRLDHDQIIDAMIHDKKSRDGRLRFVLPKCLGQTDLVEDISDNDLRAVLRGVDA